jgi:hypothetical protein
MTGAKVLQCHFRAFYILFVLKWVFLLYIMSFLQLQMLHCRGWHDQHGWNLLGGGGGGEKCDSTGNLEERLEFNNHDSKYVFTILYSRFCGWCWYKSSVFLVLTQRKVVLCRRSGTTYRSHLHGSSSPLNMGLIGSPETSVSSHLTLRDNPEDGRFYFNRGGNLN